MFFVLGVSGFSTVSGTVENAFSLTMGNVYCRENTVFLAQGDISLYIYIAVKNG